MNMFLEKKKKGFTLIELIAVIAILGILAAIIIPKMLGYTDSARLAKEQAECKSILNQVEIYDSTATTLIIPSTTGIAPATALSVIADIAQTPNTGDLASLTSLEGTITSITSVGSPELITGSTTLLQVQNAYKATTYADFKTAI